MIRNIIFDWSGTLVDDLPAVWRASNYVLEQAGAPAMSLEDFRLQFSLPFTEFYDRILVSYDLAALEAWYHQRFEEVQHTVEALPHAQEFLEFARQKKIRSYLFSAIHERQYGPQREKIGFHEYFDAHYIGIRDKRESIRALIETHRLLPEETVFIGDMPHDVDAAKRGGVYSCAVLTGYSPHSQLRSAGADLIVENLRELQAELDRHEMRFPGVEIRSTAETPRPIATVGALILDDSNRLLMAQTQKWSDLWGIPGGKIEWGEPSKDALSREILEETGLEVDDIEFVMVQDCIRSPEFYREAHFLLLNYVCRRVSGDVVLNHEARAFRWVSTEEALAMPLNSPTRTLIEVALEKGMISP